MSQKMKISNYKENIQTRLKSIMYSTLNSECGKVWYIFESSHG